MDEQGGRGKTKFLSWLGTHPNSQYLNLEKKSELLWNTKVDTHNIFLNIPRGYPQDMVNYGAMETLKDGNWTCSKYQGKTCSLGVQGIAISLVVAMNFPPNELALSADRYEVWHLDYLLYQESPV